MEPVKCRPAKSGWSIATALTSAPSPWTRLITPSGRPAACSSCIRNWAAKACFSDGFHTTVLPQMAGAVGRLPAIAVKLKGVTASTKPSSGRYSSWFHVPAGLKGWVARISP